MAATSSSSAALRGLELLTRVPLLLRLDVAPFALLYAAAARGSLQLGASGDATYARFQLAPLVLAALLHALVLLAQQWSVRARRFVLGPQPLLRPPAWAHAPARRRTSSRTCRWRATWTA